MSTQYRSTVNDDADDFSIPDRSSSEDDILAYGNSVIGKGLAFLRSQPAYPDVAKGRAIVHSMETYGACIDDGGVASDKLSRVRVPRIKRQIREIVATLSNLRPTWDYISTDPTKYEIHANVINKLMRTWFFGEEVDRSIRKALQYAAVEGTGYLHITYEKPLRESQGRIVLTPLGACGYIPFQQSFDNKIQNAEVGIICTEIPIQRARRLYKLPRLQPTNSTATNLVKGGVAGLITNMVNTASVYLSAGGTNRRKAVETNTPTVNIYHLYLKDDSINESGVPIKMGNFSADGKALDNFSYIVPSLGDPIPTGIMTVQKDENGQPRLNPITSEPTLTEETRLAEASDCMLYPNLRLIIMSPEDLIYDGPSMWWHGKIPIVQFKLDDWPWNFLGFSLIRDTWRMEESINSRLRARDDAINAKLNPAFMIDSRMSEEFQGNITPRIPGLRVVKPPMVDHPVEPLVPANYFEMGNIDAEIASDEKRLDFLLGVAEIDALMKLKQMPQSDALDKVIGASTSIIIDVARNMESSIRQLGDLWLPLAMEFYSTGDRLREIGEDGIVMEDLDFDPGNMIPSHLPGEDVTKPSRATKIERARFFMSSFRFNVVPNTFTQITAITRKMLTLQLWRDKSFPMDPWSFAEQMEIGDMGAPPIGAKNMIERWAAWQEMIVKFQQAMGGGPEDQKHPGRPPSGGQPPHFEKNGATVAES